MPDLGRVAERWVGSSWAFLIALGSVVLWAITGPLFGFSDTWQLVINTGTTVVTFLVVFLIQGAQNRDVRAIHLKLDELIVASKRANNQFVRAEDLSTKELEEVRRNFQELTIDPEKTSFKSTSNDIR